MSVKARPTRAATSGLVQGQLHDPLADIVRNAVPDAIRPGRAIAQSFGPAGVIKIVPAVEGRPWNKACPIDRGDPLLELVPENYLDEAPPTATEIAAAGIEAVVRDAAACLVRTGNR